MATTETKLNPKIDFMPHWKRQDQCFEEEQTEIVDSVYGKKIMKNGKPVVKPWPHDKPIAQISYENWLEQVVNPNTNEFYPALDKGGNPIKGTGPKHTITQIIRFRRRDGSEFLYSLGEVKAYDAFGNVVGCTIAKPEMWTKTLFNHTRVYDQRTNTTKMETSGTLGTEDVYEIPFNVKNLKALVSLRASDADISFTLKEESNGKAVGVRKESNINKTMELFLKPFDYLFNAEYITPQQKAELRQMAVDDGLIAPSTPVVAETSAPPKGTYG
jgi:hypothetical protein